MLSDETINRLSRKELIEFINEFLPLFINEQELKRDKLNIQGDIRRMHEKAEFGEKISKVPLTPKRMIKNATAIDHDLEARLKRQIDDINETLNRIHSSRIYRYACDLIPDAYWSVYYIEKIGTVLKNYRASDLKEAINVVVIDENREKANSKLEEMEELCENFKETIYSLESKISDLEEKISDLEEKVDRLQNNYY